MPTRPHTPDTPRRPARGPRALARISQATLAALALPSCADPQPERPLGPRVESTSSAVVVVGQTLELFGRGFLRPEEGVSRLRFEGSFTDSYGATAPVTLTVTPLFGGEETLEAGAAGAAGDTRQILTWSRVGPFKNPFTSDARHGVFRGAVQVLNERADGLAEAGPAVPMNLSIGPSISIEALEPVDADCGAPAPRALPGVPYRLRVQVSGLAATRFVYVLSDVNARDGLTTFEHDLGAAPTDRDALGEQAELVVFNAVPDDLRSYIASIRVIAYDAAGDSVETALPLSVHRPLEVIYDGKLELAERYEPVPVSGCIPGGIGTNIEYEESSTEVRAQSVSVTLSNAWRSATASTLSESMSEGVALGESASRRLGEQVSEREALSESTGETYTSSETNDVGFSSTNGEEWSWSMSQGETAAQYQARMSSRYAQASGEVSVGVEGEASIPVLAGVSASGKVSAGVMGGVSSGETTRSRDGTSSERGYSMSGSARATQRFGTSVSEGRSRSVQGVYVASTDRSVNVSTAEGMSSGRSWDLREGTERSAVVSEGNAEALREAVFTSEGKTVTLGFGGYVPRGYFGMFYRQATRWVRRAEVRSFDLCGVAYHMGELQFNEWDWAPDLAVGPECDGAPPASSLPRAECLLPPCDQ
ncbi:MAG: hypothetical protein FJ138_02075 [Deltaproteobacteria bacterium]|nr:hypothetical protein [Deltaproteobacteria bacterium]